MTVHRFGWKANISTLLVKTGEVEIELRGYESSPDQETTKAVASGVLEGMKGWIP